VPDRRRLLLAALAFALIILLIGAILVLMLAGLANPLRPVSGDGLLIALAIAYGFFGLQALLTGIGTVALAARQGRSPIWHPILVVAVIHAAAVVIVVAYPIITQQRIDRSVSYFLVGSPLVCIIGASVCWFIARPLLRAR
jgi:hypothetical protein